MSIRNIKKNHDGINEDLSCLTSKIYEFCKKHRMSKLLFRYIQVKKNLNRDDRIDGKNDFDLSIKIRLQYLELQ